MTNKHQKIHFNKARLLKIETLNTIEDGDGHKHFVEYSKLRLAIISGQLCFVDPNDYFIPIARISIIENIIKEEIKNRDRFKNLDPESCYATKEDYENEED